MRPTIIVVTSSFLLATLAAQDQDLRAVTEERLTAAYADARAACKDVLSAELDTLPPLKLVDMDEIAKVVADENLAAVRLRQPDEDKARAEAEQLGRQLAAFAYAKYAWSTRTFLVVPKTWEKNARVLERPQLTSDETLRAVMVHELCHALDDRKFDFGKRIAEATTIDGIIALNAVIEGHAQLTTRRVCKVRGWTGGFDAYTSSIAALPADNGEGEALLLLRRATAAALEAAYVDGERFAAAVIEARPETGAQDIFVSPPKDAETILQPRWYLDPATRPAVLHDPEPAIDAFVAKFDPDVWSSVRSNANGKQLAVGLAALPKEDIDAIVKSLRAARLVQLAPTAAPQSKVRIMIVMEFDSEASAARWVRLSGVISDKKNETMREGIVRITGSKTTKLEETVQGLLQEKSMRSGSESCEGATIDAWQGRLVVETIYSAEPPPMAEHVALVAEIFEAVVLKK